ncbi:serine hydrolase domain-containing protein [Labrenzia sp. 011]|uniref:serine hydrolase domain-containing protein n=1 Tax=Labrenzia sp. 011 TaxID=2171494 RepID=UPI0014031529|nr:serine hydrolase domain-containing protein [Labrenzia sp. 011]
MTDTPNNSRFARRLIGLAGLAGLLLVSTPLAAQETDPRVSAVQKIAQDAFDTLDLNALLLEVRIDGEPLVTLARGEAMPGVPLTVDGQFRNGAVALTYVAALALRLAEAGRFDLDRPIAEWLPDLPAADTATPRMLLNMTAGYPDHAANDKGFLEPFYADPFHQWTPEELIDVSLSTPRRFAPGENWDYSHSGYVILGRVLEAATGESLAALMQHHVLDPLELSQTHDFDTPYVPQPVVHSYTGERGVWEDATYWNPSWTLPRGAVQVTSISDMARSFDRITGIDGFLQPDSRKAMIEPSLIGFGSPLEGCPNCRTLNSTFSYGLGTMLLGDWIAQTPSFAGNASAVATLPEGRSPEGRVTIAVAVTYREAAFDDWQGNVPNRASDILLEIAGELVPDTPPPGR